MGDTHMMEAGGAGAEPVSLYQRILGEIRDRILSGEWPPGHRVPFEHELSAIYHCSRMTVNKALSQLAKAGLIERRRRSGSFVRRPQLQSAVLEIHDIKTEVLALGLPYRYELAERRQHATSPADLARLDLPPHSAVLDLSCRHFAGDRPFCLEQRLISLAAVPEAAEENFEEIAPGPWLISRVPWSAAEHTIRAAGADRETAAALDIAKGTACLVIERRTWSSDRAVTHVRLTYAGSSHALVARFEPSQG